MAQNFPCSFRALLFSFAFISMLCQPLSALAVQDPIEQLRPFLQKVTETLNDPELYTLSRKEQSEILVELVRERFDFYEMSRRVLGPHWRNIDAEEREQFVTLFTQLLQYAYIDRIDDYSGQEVEFVGQRIRGDRAEVQTILVDRDRSYNVSYIMHLQEDRWMAYDIVAEGVSLVRNYMEQFREIIRRHGYIGLIRKLEERIDELDGGKREAT
ncbi:MlaC/ttg2D family ABC transporter substrate-binding protein [Desulfobulbus alkaliphilus]|uniref:MlaC/ttg2D family ABC transporter substrate-binding protein n=1 Tax=Desulfobulbus alkaliphilus TaxID=869814 RepID=UPI001964D2C8|nr:ABC transporter substrate-binding protein [Desulfobulbus alkaliphilus]MBM9535759.1 ABC transporter substrate-binding protein [Desulfobulbus alkaliphilus]